MASVVLGAATLLVARRRFELARWGSAATVSCLVAAWVFAQSPDLPPGGLTLAEAAAGDATLSALLISLSRWVR